MKDIQIEKQSFIYDTLFPSSSTNKAVKIRVTSTHFAWECNNQSHLIPMDWIIGFRHVKASALSNSHAYGKSSLCDYNDSVNNLELVETMISPASTGYWSVFCYDIRKSKRGDLEKPIFRRILF